MPAPLHQPIPQQDHVQREETYNIIPIQIIQNIHNNNNRQQPPIYFAHETFLSFGALLWRQASHIGRCLFLGIGLVVIGYDFDVVGVSLDEVVVGLDLVGPAGGTFG